MNAIGAQRIQVPKVDRGHYDFWCVKMKTIPLSYDLLGDVKEGFI